MTANASHATMASAVALALLAMGLAGCSGLDDSDAETLGRNQAPTAQLDASEDVAWTGEAVAFDAAGSSDPDGEIVSYRFDFGDDTPPVERDGTASDEPSVSHAYLRGGEYVVTLTVTDDGGNETGSLTGTDTVRITINEEFEVSEVVQQTPVNGTEDQEVAFDVNQAADRFEVELDVQNNALLASSEVTVEVVGPDNE